MDNLGFFLISRSHSETYYRDIIILFMLVPLFKYLFNDLSNINNYIKNLFFNNYINKIEFTGWENLNAGIYAYDYPLPMTAICHRLSQKNICTNLRYFNPSRNGIMYGENLQTFYKNKTISYIINYGKHIKIEEDLFLDFNYYTMEKSKDSKSDANWKVNIILKSKFKSIIEINKFIKQCIKEFDEFLEEKNKNKIYHFIYQCKDKCNDKKLNFSTSILSDFSDTEKTNYETFKNIYSEHKDMLLKDINRLKDIEYYKNTGNKRKKGYLFHGPPGCGKTSSVIALALEDKRHIIEISMSRIKTNEELELLFNISEINGVKIQKNQIIMLFDEIDNGSKILKTRDSENIESDDQKIDKKDEIIYKLMNKDNDDDFTFKKDDQVHLGCVLSRFDGVGSYNGLIIVATTNCKEKLSPALYRNGRLNPVFFDYITRDQIKQMVEDYFKIKLSSEQILRFPCKSSKISHSSLRKYLEDYENNQTKLFAFLETLNTS